MVASPGCNSSFKFIKKIAAVGGRPAIAVRWVVDPPSGSPRSRRRSRWLIVGSLVTPEENNPSSQVGLQSEFVVGFVAAAVAVVEAVVAEAVSSRATPNPLRMSCRPSRSAAVAARLAKCVFGIVVVVCG